MLSDGACRVTETGVEILTAGKRREDLFGPASS